MRLFILDEQKQPVRVYDIAAWAAWMARHDCRIAFDIVDGVPRDGDGTRRRRGAVRDDDPRRAAVGRDYAVRDVRGLDSRPPVDPSAT